MPKSAASKKVESPFAQSSWMWPDWGNWDLVNGYALFRKTFALKQLPAKAPMWITADQAYHLYINDRFVARGPARGYQESWPYDEIDVRSFLKEGTNLIAVRAYNPGRSTFQYIAKGAAGLLVTLKCGAERIVSDGSWKCIRQGSINRGAAPAGLCLPDQEHIDLREESGDWRVEDFDDGKWTAPYLAVFGSAPWFGMEPRGIPMLEERKMTPAALVGIGEGESAVPHFGARDIVMDVRFKEDRSHRPAAVDFAPLKVKATGRGKFRSYLFDFGKTVVGNLTLRVKGARGGEIIDTHHAETINAVTLVPDLNAKETCRMSFGDRLICRAGEFAHTFFHYYGFRYLEINARDAEEDFEIGLELNWVGYPLPRLGSFRSSDGDLEKIWETCAWGQQCCSLDAYVDTPWREQAQWWGDARVQGWNTFHLSGDARLFRRGIAQIAGQRTPDGVTYGHAPTNAHSCILPDFALIWILTIWDYYWQTGGLEPLWAHEEVIDGVLEYFRNFTDAKTGLVKYDRRYWLFLDWVDLFKDGYPAVLNLWLLIALEKLIVLRRLAKKPAGDLVKWEKKLRAALEKLVNREGLMRDGVDWKGKVPPSTSIHAQTLALMAKLRGLKAEAAVEKILLPCVSGAEVKLPPSAYWITYVFDVLIEQGRGAEVVRDIRKRWLPMTAQGSTWESFEPAAGNGSHSHAWSAHPLFHLMRTVGGIEQTAAGWKEIRFKPLFEGVHGGATVPSPRGTIKSDWKKTKKGVEVRLDLPRGVRAWVELPGVKPHWAKGKSRWMVEAR